MLLPIIRFIVFATLYIAVVVIWANREGGHGAMGILAGALFLSGGAAAAWLVGMIAERYSNDLSLRIFFHVVSTIATFCVISFVILALLGANDLDIYLNFGGIVAGASFVDGLVGLLAARSKRDTV